MSSPRPLLINASDRWLYAMFTLVFCCIGGGIVNYYKPLPLPVGIVAGIVIVVFTLFNILQGFPTFFMAAWNGAQHRVSVAVVSLLTSLILCLFTALLLPSSPAQTTSSHGPVAQVSPTSGVPTPTAIPRITPTTSAPTPTPQATPFFSDPMTASQHGTQWDTCDNSGSCHDETGSCGFAADGYHIRANNNYHECLDYRDVDLTNYTIEAHVTFVKGNSAGVILRRDPGDKEQDYLVEFDATGHYILYKDPNNTVLEENFSSHIRQNQTSYLIDVTIVANQMTLDVDHVQIVSLADKDNTYHQGEIGLYVTGHQDPPTETEAVFTNVTLWKL